MAVYEEKFIVINHKHLDRISEDEKKFLHVILMKLANHNNYYVCNQDEPYAQKVIGIILTGEDEKLSLPVKAGVSQENGGIDLTDKVERARIFMMDVAWANDKTMTAKDAREIITRVYGKETLEKVLSRFSA